MIMRRVVCCCTAALLASCGSKDDVDAGIATHDVSATVLPAPVFIEHEEGRLRFTDRIVVEVPEDSRFETATQWFAERAAADFGIGVDIRTDVDADAAIRLEPVAREHLESMLAAHTAERDSAWREGAYFLETDDDFVRIAAADDAGMFYGATTLWQLLSPDGAAAAVMPQTTILDKPRFAWRGLMLDSARHLQSAAFIRQYLDWMAVHKLNVLHWHLSDDQAWRLEIRKHPDLTRTGAWRIPAYVGPGEPPEPYGGYFTQDDVREIVAHAAKRHVTVVPEIDVPGHTTAAIVAYPELGIEGQAPDAVPANWGIYDNVLNLEDDTLAFFEDVLSEVTELFPSTFVHLGGDEVVTRQWLESARARERMAELGIADEQALQSYHFRMLERFLDERGRRAIGWDEIVEGEIPADAAVISWRGTAGGIEAAKEGHDVVRSPAPTLYLDHLQTDAADAPPGRWAVMTTRDVYEFDPLPAELAPYRERVLGVQGNLWTEHVRTEERVEYMSYPRGAAIAELGWSRPESRDWNAFLERLADQFARYERLGLGAADAPFAVRIDARRGEGDVVTVELRNQSDFGRIRYTTDGSEPAGDAPGYTGPLELTLPVTVSAGTWHEGRALGRPRTARIDELSLLNREDRELELCTERIVLALDDDAPAGGRRESFLVDIMNPCWIMRDVDTSAVAAVRAAVGQLPFNFEIGDALEHVVVREPRTAGGEFVVREGSCDGPVAASLPLAPAVDDDTVTELPDTPLAFENEGAVTDLCFHFTRGGVEPIRVVDWVQLLPAEAE